MKLFGAKEATNNDTSFKDWRRRFGETTMEKLGIRTTIKDEVTGDVEGPLFMFRSTVDRLKSMEDQAMQFTNTIDAHLLACSRVSFMLEVGDMGLQILDSLSSPAIGDVVRRGMYVLIERPLKSMKVHVMEIEAKVIERQNYILDYQHHKRKYKDIEEKLGKTSDPAKRDQLMDEMKARKVKLENATKVLRDTTSYVLAQLEAFDTVFPRLRKQIAMSVFAVERFLTAAMSSALDRVTCDDEITALIATLTGPMITNENEPLRYPEYISVLRNLSGESLGLVFHRPLSLWGDTVPDLVTQSIIFIEHGNFLYTQGLFRVPGDESNVEYLRRAFDDGKTYEEIFSNPEIGVHDVCSCLKLFVRKLPGDPVVPRCKFKPLLTNATSSQAITRILYEEDAAPVHRRVLRMLLGLLVRISLCASHNLMTSDNLAIVFAPTLLRPPLDSVNRDGDDEVEIGLSDLQPCISLIKRLIDNAEEIFPNIWNDYPTTQGASSSNKDSDVMQAKPTSPTSALPAATIRMGRSMSSEPKQPPPTSMAKPSMNAPTLPARPVLQQAKQTGGTDSDDLTSL